jgi:hypothetical protein
MTTRHLWAVGVCASLCALSFGIAFVADRRLGVAMPYSLLIAPIASVMLALALPAGLEFLRSRSVMPARQAAVSQARRRSSANRPEGFVIFETNATTASGATRRTAA